MKKVLIACLPDPSGNPRPFRAIKLLKSMGFNVYTLSPKPRINIKEIDQIYEINSKDVSLTFKFLRRFLIYINYFFGIFLKPNISFFNFTYSIIWGLNKHSNKLKNQYFDIVLSENLSLLPFIFSTLDSKSKVILDAREYYPKEIEGSFFFRNFVSHEKKHLCNLLLKKLDDFYTVSDGLSDLYYKEFSIKPKVIRSTPLYQNSNLKEISSYPVKLVHHGIANRDRCIENMIDIINELDGLFTLDFYLNGESKYIKELKKRAAKSNFIKFNKVVEFKEINNMLNKYDIGFYFLKPTGFNTTYNLPNKFFEFIQAGLGMIIGPSPEMSKIAREYSVAIISSDFSIKSMVEKLRRTSISEFNSIKKNSIRFSKELSWETESYKLKSIINSLLKKN